MSSNTNCDPIADLIARIRNHGITGFKSTHNLGFGFRLVTDLDDAQPRAIVHDPKRRPAIPVTKQRSRRRFANLLKARLARDAGEIDTAETLLNAAVLRAPADFVASNELARTLAASKDLPKRKTGLEYATRNYRLVTNRATPVGREATVTLAWLLLVNDRADDAEHVLLTLPDGSTVSNENAYLAAQIYAKLKRRDSATQALRAALAGDVYFPGRGQAEKLLAEFASNKM